MAANQNTNNVPNIQTNSKQTQVNSSHIHSQSHGQMSQFMRTNCSRYQSSPIVHWGNQYNSNANMNIFYQNNMRHAVNPSGNVAPYQQNESQIQKLKQSQPQPTPQQTKNKNKPKNNKNRGSHTRDSSLSMSYIQQRQQAFFSDNPPEPISDSDDEIYGDMYKDGLGANNINVKPLNPKSHKNKKKPKKKANKSRKETEDVWCCSICTYQNNMLLGYCELCGCKKSETPNIVKRVVYPDNNEHKNKDNNNSPSPSPPPQQPPKDDIGLFDLTNNNNNKQQEIPDLLSIPPPQEEHSHTQPKKSKPKVPIPRRQQLQKHRSTQSEPNVLEVARYWQCGVCTFGENPIERPVCKLCGAIPPERPPSPNPPFSIDPKQIKHNEHLLDSLHNEHPNPNGINDEILDLNEETDPLGHQKSASITELPMIDESILHKEKTPPIQAQAPNVYDFGFNNNKLSAQMQAKSNKKDAVLSNLSKLMVDGQATGGVVFPNAAKSAQNIRELHVQPQAYEIPDLPAEKMEQMEAKSQPNNQRTIADLGVSVGVDINANSSGNVSGSGSGSGIGGWFGKVYNGVRRRAQSNENNPMTDNSLSPGISSTRSRSKSPRGLRKIKEELGRQHSSKRNISVATMPKKQQEKIAKRLNGLHTKKDLLRELDSSQQKLQKKLKQHANKVMQLKSEINVLEDAKFGELKQWNAWYVLELVDIAKEYYSHKLSQINHQIELEKLHIECFTEKLQRLENANKNIRKNNKKWNIDDIRNNIEVAFHTAWRIRLSQDVPDKQDYVKQLKQLTHNLQNSYELKRATLGKAVISLEERKEQVFLFLQSVLAKYESTQMIENKQFKLSRNLDADDSFFAPYNEADQNVFDSFILDQRTKEGRIVSRWLIFIRKKHADITFEDLSDFMQKLAHTLLHSYSLQTKQYYECVRILCFRCIFRRRIIKKIIYELLQTQSENGQQKRESQSENPEVVNMRQMVALDGIYQKKVMWMRALNETQLGIKKDYWTPQKAVQMPAIAVDHSLRLPGHEKVSSQNGRRSSQIALLAGRDIPFAESINLMGQLEIDQQVIDEYKESLRVFKLSVSNAQSLKMRPKRSLFTTRSNYNAKQSLEEERKRNEELSEYNNIVPFILPQTGLQTLLAATKSIYNNAIKYYYIHYPEKVDDENDDGVFVSQDDLFPIILYCVIQSKLETPHRLIHFIEHILPRDKTTMGQSAFALSALKAAVEYISQAKPPTFGMDAEIELD